MTNVIDEITRWATRNLPFWEQAALDRILAGEAITENLVEELVDFLLEDAGLQEKRRERPNLTYLVAGSLPINSSDGRCRLVRIHNIKNINALVPNQRLEFGNNLTVIYGDNGSGKSGYARIIGSAAFTRGDKQVLGNVMIVQQPGEPLSADIDLISDDGLATTIHYVVGDTCPKLRSFYVFDSTSVRNHLTKENPMSFSPTGLEVLTALSSQTDRVRKLLEEKCAQKNCASNIFDSLFAGDTRVKGYIKILGANSDLNVLEKLAFLTDDEKSRVAQLELQIAEIRSQRIQETIDQLTLDIQDLETLRESLLSIEKWMQSDEIITINGLIDEFHQHDTVVQMTRQASTMNFRHSLPDPAMWDRFIRAAYALGQAESKTYPSSGDRCLLCDQPLTIEAQGLITRIWASINDEAGTQRKEIDQRLFRCSAPIHEFDFDILGPATAAYRCIQRYDPEILSSIRANLLESKRICDGVQNAIFSHQKIKVKPLKAVGSEVIEKLIFQLRDEQIRLIEQNTELRLQQLEKENLELQHRVILSGQIEAIKDFVQRAKWVKQANSPAVKRSTKHITQKYNELFDQLVTQRYIDLFEQTLINLKCPLRVKVETRGSKGETRKQIVLMRDDNESCCSAAPDKVLSEGEQRAVALADFLTEVALDDKSTGILLDDPVTSLDFQWKETIARHVVEEASRQQVIVFTHDMHFLFCMKKYAEELQVEICGHWIQRRNDQPGWVFLNNSPASEKDFRSATKAKEFCQRVKRSNLDAEEEQLILSAGFGALRTSYEAFIMYDLFGGVVLRFGERISGDRLGTVYIDESIRDEVIDSIGRLSRYIDAHLHSDAFSAQKPTVELLAEEIAKFDALKARHKEIKKQHGIKD